MAEREHRIEWANALRAIAAVTVVLYHLCQAFWVHQREAAGLLHREPLYTDTSQAPGLARWLAACPIDLGAFGVALFFVLSGFVIAVSVDRYSRPGFAVGRTLRLVPTYAVAFLVGLLIVLSFGASGSGAGEDPTWWGSFVGTVPGLSVLTDAGAISLGVDWTLDIEIVFYAVCLLAYTRLTRSWVVPLAVLVGCVSVQVVIGSDDVRQTLPDSLNGAAYLLLLTAPFLPLMLVGIVVSAVHREQLGPWSLLSLPVLVGTGQWLMATSEAVPTSGEYQASVIAAVPVFLVTWRLGGGWSPGRVLRYLSDVSYPLYLTHAMVGYALLAVLTQWGWASMPAIAVTLVVALLVATAVHRLVELPTHGYGQRCARRAGRRTAPAPRSAEPVSPSQPVLQSVS
jgi:peptidoglycan/LPS O-acetylase OafA/YrhL